MPSLDALLDSLPWQPQATPATHPRDQWWTATVAEFPPAFGREALAWELFETHDFRSSFQRLMALASPEAEPPVLRSRFQRWWQGDPQAKRVPHHAQFQVWLVVRDARPIALAVWDRPHDRIHWAPEPTQGRTRPRFVQAMRLWGTGMFYVAPECRGQGVGQALAQALVAALRTAQAQAPWAVSAVPVLAARDRAHKLLEPWTQDLGLVQEDQDNHKRLVEHWRLVHDPWADEPRFFPTVVPASLAPSDDPQAPLPESPASPSQRRKPRV